MSISLPCLTTVRQLPQIIAGPITLPAKFAIQPRRSHKQTAVGMSPPLPPLPSVEQFTCQAGLPFAICHLPMLSYMQISLRVAVCQQFVRLVARNIVGLQYGFCVMSVRLSGSEVFGNFVGCCSSAVRVADFGQQYDWVLFVCRS